MFILFLVRFGFLRGHLLGNSSLGRQYVFFVFWLFLVLVVSRFGFGGWIWILIASVPEFCVLFTFVTFSMFQLLF